MLFIIYNAGAMYLNVKYTVIDRKKQTPASILEIINSYVSLDEYCVIFQFDGAGITEV